MMTPDENEIRELTGSDLTIPCIINTKLIKLFDLNEDVLNKIFKYINDDLNLRLITPTDI